MAEHGTRQRYADDKCRCEPCKAAMSQYMREWKARRAGADIPAPTRGRPRKAAVAVDGSAAGSATVTALPGAAPSPVRAAGQAEAAVLEELASLTSAETRKGAAQAALAMARILDNPLALSQQPAAAARLTAILEELRKGSARTRGRLASVQAMTKATG